MIIDTIKDKDSDTRRNHKTAADIYQVQSYYQRFDSKNHVPRSQVGMELQQLQNDKLRKNIASNLPGYGLRDWAFFTGAIANMINSGFNIVAPNRSGNSWLPIAKRTQAKPAPNQMSSAISFGKLEADESATTRWIKKISRQFGADEVGICLLDRRWVYSHWYDDDAREHYPIKFSDEAGYEEYQEPIQLDDKTLVIPENMKYVVVMIHEMDELGIASAPSLTMGAIVQSTYSRISFTAVMLAEFIRGLGYNAIPSANDTTLNIPLAIDAGLGELGRNSKLITPSYGPRCRISKVITDLPLDTGEPKLWGVTKFCNTCKKCAQNCPAKAIPFGERSFEAVDIFNTRGVLQWPLDHMKCSKYSAKAGGCAICIRACPFNKSRHWSHNLVRSFIRMKSRHIDSLITRMDDILGFGKYKNPEEFWSQY